MPMKYDSLICNPLLIGTDWAGGVYKVVMEFPEEYPTKVLSHILTLDLFYSLQLLLLCIVFQPASKVQIRSSFISSQRLSVWYVVFFSMIDMRSSISYVFNEQVQFVLVFLMRMKDGDQPSQLSSCC